MAPKGKEKDWWRDGDRNTKYFHACANQQQRRNRIEQIQDKEERLCADQTSIEQAFTAYYQDLFTTAVPHNMEARSALMLLEEDLRVR
jgi:hypothetical protein